MQYCISLNVYKRGSLIKPFSGRGSFSGSEARLIHPLHGLDDARCYSGGNVDTDSKYNGFRSWQPDSTRSSLQPARVSRVTPAGCWAGAMTRRSESGLPATLPPCSSGSSLLMLFRKGRPVLRQLEVYGPAVSRLQTRRLRYCAEMAGPRFGTKPDG
jgi:hypothetical protein